MDKWSKNLLLSESIFKALRHLITIVFPIASILLMTSYPGFNDILTNELKQNIAFHLYVSSFLSIITGLLLFYNWDKLIKKVLGHKPPEETIQVTKDIILLGCFFLYPILSAYTIQNIYYLLTSLKDLDPIITGLVTILIISIIQIVYFFSVILASHPQEKLLILLCNIPVMTFVSQILYNLTISTPIN